MCNFYNIKPVRSKGQNFLINEQIYDKIVQEAELKQNDHILEIGPGAGILTFKLADRAKKIIALELDDDLVEFLCGRVDSAKAKNIEILNKDVLKIEKKDLQSLKKDYKIVANLPYNITSRFLRRFLSENELRPKSMVLLLQREVAQRIVASPPNMSLLALSVQYFSRPRIVENVPASCFWPKPRVDSAVVKFEIKKDLDLSRKQEKKLFDLIRTGFRSKRKMLKNNLSSGLKIDTRRAEEILKKMGLNFKIRAQELDLKDWKRLLEKLR